LISAIIIINLLLAVSIALTKLAYDNLAATVYYCERLQAFYLAEAGLNIGKNQLDLDPNWNSPGKTISFEAGNANIIREKNKNKLYSYGTYKRALVILQYDLYAKKWEEL